MDAAAVAISPCPLDECMQIVSIFFSGLRCVCATWRAGFAGYKSLLLRIHGKHCRCRGLCVVAVAPQFWYAFHATILLSKGKLPWLRVLQSWWWDVFGPLLLKGNVPVIARPQMAHFLVIRWHVWDACFRTPAASFLKQPK